MGGSSPIEPGPLPEATLNNAYVGANRDGIFLLLQRDSLAMSVRARTSRDEESRNACGSGGLVILGFARR